MLKIFSDSFRIATRTDTPTEARSDKRRRNQEAVLKGYQSRAILDAHQTARRRF